MQNPNHFEQDLNIILEEADIFDDAVVKLKKVEGAKKGVADLQADLDQSLETLHGQLATTIRRTNRNLDVWLDQSGSVRVRYGSRTRLLQLRADAKNHCWSVGDTPFERQFAKYNNDALSNGDLTILAKAIAHFFLSNYRTLRNKT